MKMECAVRNLMLFALAFILNCGIHVFAGEAKVVHKVNTTEKKVAFTFDDGPDRNIAKIMKLFGKYDFKVTFFLIGKNVSSNKALVKSIIENGNEIGNHSFSHQDLTKAQESVVKEEVDKSQKDIEECSGVLPVLFRAPFQRYNENLWKALDEAKLTAIGGDINTKDWSRKTTAEDIYQKVTSNLKPGSIILMHSSSAKSYSVLPKILDYIKEKGYSAVTVSELLKK